MFVVFRVGENAPSGKSQKGSLLAREGTGGGWLQVIIGCKYYKGF
jgi:hypothetical protein